MSPAVGAGQGWAAAGLDPARQRAAAAGKGGLCRQQMASAVFRLISPSGRPGSGDGNKEKAEKGTRCSRGIRRPGLCSAGRSGPARAGAALRPGGVLRPGRAAWPLPGSRSRRGGGVQPAGRACGSTQSSATAGRVSAAAAAARQSSNACAVRRAAASVRRRRTVKAWPALCSAGQDCTAGRTGRTAGAWPWPAARQQAASAAEKAAAIQGAVILKLGPSFSGQRGAAQRGRHGMDGGSRVQAAGVQSVRRRARRRRPAGGRGLSPQHPAEKGAWRGQARTTSGQICTVQGRAQALPRCDALSIPPPPCGSCENLSPRSKKFSTAMWKTSAGLCAFATKRRGVFWALCWFFSGKDRSRKRLCKNRVKKCR